jgi:hypothetical protein
MFTRANLAESTGLATAIERHRIAIAASAGELRHDSDLDVVLQVSNRTTFGQNDGDS